MALVTIDDLRNYMDISFSNRQEDGAQLVLDGLQSELEFILRRPVEVGVFTEKVAVPDDLSPYSFPLFSYNQSAGTRSYVHLYDTFPTYVHYLDQSPIVSIQSVSRISPLSSASVGLEDGKDYIPTDFGLYMYTVHGGDEATVTYTAGMVGENYKFFKLVILRAASREVQNLHDDVVGLKDLNTRNVAPLEIGFTAAEEHRLKRYKRQRI